MMHLRNLLVPVFSLLTLGSALSIRAEDRFSQPEGFRKFYSSHERRDLNPGVVVPLYHGVTPVAHHAVQYQRRDKARGVSPITAITFSLLADVRVGGQTFAMIVSAGSSDTVVMASDFNCFDYDRNALPQSACNVPNTYDRTPTAQVVENMKLDIFYQSGEFLKGPMLLETVEVAGVTVEKAQITAADNVYWTGEGVKGGILGLCFPPFGFGFDSNNKSVFYDGVFTKMVQQKVVEPFFSTSIDTVSSGPAGFLVYGGLPPVAHNATFTTTPILKQNFNFQGPLDSPQYVQYRIGVQSFTVASIVTETQNLEMFVDTGSYFNFIPDDIASMINGLWNPPAVFSDSFRLFKIDCAATAPEVSVTISGTRFFIKPTGGILLSAEGDCYSAWQGGGAIGDPKGLFVLGLVFLKSVVTVFDVGAKEMHFAARI